MIIVEGADNVGKTTLVEQLLAEDPRLVLQKRERFKPEHGGTIGSSYIKTLAHTNRFAVVDRLLASECIYGRLFRGGCRMSAAEHFVVRSLLSTHHATIVWCDTSDDQIMASWREREQTYDNPLKIAHAYREHILRIFYPFHVIRYDWTKRDAPAYRRAILNQHERELNNSLSDFTNLSERC